MPTEEKGHWLQSRIKIKVGLGLVNGNAREGEQRKRMMQSKGRQTDQQEIVQDAQCHMSDVRCQADSKIAQTEANPIKGAAARCMRQISHAQCHIKMSNDAW